MTLKDLLWAYQNQIYRQSHTYNIPQKIFERFLDRVEVVEQRSQAHIRVLIGNVSNSKRFDTAKIDIVGKGVWVYSVEGSWVSFSNYTSRFQAEMFVKGNRHSFIVQQTFSKPLLNKYDYQKALYIASNLVKREYLKSYPEDEGYVRQKDIVLVINDYLRQQDFSARNTRLVVHQPSSYKRVIEIIEKMQNEGLLVKCEKYLNQRRKPYGDNKV